MQEFSGIWVPVVTPFAHGGEVDAAALAALVDGLVEAGGRYTRPMRLPLSRFVQASATQPTPGAAVRKQKKQQLV